METLTPAPKPDSENQDILEQLRAHGVVEEAVFRVNFTFRSNAFDVYEGTEMTITGVASDDIAFDWINVEGWANGSEQAHPDEFIEFITSGKISKIK